MPLFRSLLVLGWCGALASGAEWQLRNLKEETIKGELVALEAKSITLKTDKGDVSVPLNEVLHLEMQAAKGSGPYTLVELTDGSVLRCKPETGIQVNGKQVEFTLTSDRKVKAPLTAVSFILKEADNAKVRGNPDWKAVLKSRKSHDLFVYWLESRMNPIPGTYGEGTGTTVEFQTESGTKRQVDLNHKAVAAFVFVNKTDPNLPLPVCTVVDGQENVILAKKVALGEAGAIVVTTLYGSELTYPANQLARLDFSGGKRVYLSELDPRILEERPEDKEPVRKDKNPNDGTLTLAGQKYPRGISLFAPMVLAYPLGGEYKEFTATLGVDDNVEGNTHVKVVIEGDGRELYAQEIKKADKPKELRLSLKDVQELRIKVHPVGVLPFGHHVNIADAKVTK
jgi:hypothetical protein